MSENKREITIQEVRYGVRLNYVLFPIDPRDLNSALVKNGYELSLIRSMPPRPTNIRFGGEIARKEESTIMVESDSGEIGVISRSIEEAKSSFEGLSTVVKKNLGVNLHENVAFYWLVVHSIIETGKLPREQILKAENKEYIEKFSNVLGEELASFSLRLAPKGSIPNQKNWMDIAIEPAILNEKVYHVGVVFRDPKKIKTERFMDNLEDNLLKIIEAIEG